MRSKVRLRCSAPEPLLFDFWSDETLEPRFPPGSDYWLDKRSTDVVHPGIRHSPQGGPRLRCSSRRRLVEQPSASPCSANGSRMGPAAVRTSADLSPSPRCRSSIRNAYGGLDNRVPIPAQLEKDYMRAVRARDAVRSSRPVSAQSCGQGLPGLARSQSMGSSCPTWKTPRTCSPPSDSAPASRSCGIASLCPGVSSGQSG